ncbi:hypothetical protein GOP47_0023570 [Adiantum capillus-veneris]|uniref:Secreted protein n=1 Tax=Adiantum capillus-veneris TaxID=13818 RepID=A0A9D4U4R4_ADICA|nr:hypothetical protein GOP47_0023570 [Adiantum capillus-veneris]
MLCEILLAGVYSLFLTAFIEALDCLDSLQKTTVYFQAREFTSSNTCRLAPSTAVAKYRRSSKAGATFSMGVPLSTSYMSQMPFNQKQEGVVV